MRSAGIARSDIDAADARRLRQAPCQGVLATTAANDE
jgi:hypothetical protein